MNPPRPGGVRLAAALAVLLAGAVVLPSDAATCRASGRLTPRADGWTAVTVPSFGDGGPDVVAVFAVASDDEDSILVSNGTSVQRSTDGGCTWSVALHPEPLLEAAHVVKVSAIAHVPQVDAPDAAIVVGHESRPDEVGGVEHPRVWVSTDGGQSFVDGIGLPPVGRALGIREALPPGTAVAAVTEPDDAGTRFFATKDAGQTWTPAQPAAGAASLTRRVFVDFVIDPRQPTKVWAWNSDGLFRSDSGGGSFTPVAAMATPITAMDVAPSPSAAGVSRLRAFLPTGASRYSDDLGATWTQEVEAAGAVTAVASLPETAGLYATASPRGVFVQRAGKPVLRLSPRRFAVIDLELSVTINPFVYAGNGERLLRRRMFDPASGITVVPDSVGVLNAAPPATVQPALLVPEHSALQIGAGRHLDVSYTLALPPTPTPLDIYFLADTTPSMAPVLNRLRQELAGVINDLAEQGIASLFGIADFREYPAFGAAADNYPYRRLRPVGPVNGALRTALDSMTTGGGTRDDTHAGLEALYQSATGAGRAVVEPAGNSIVHIPPGQDARFRRDAVKVIVMATDRAWRDARPGYPGPDRGVVFDALRQARVHVVGLGVAADLDAGAGVGGPGPPLRDAAKETGTFAPAGGVDCDDDGTVDLPEGEPLVCRLSPDGTPKVGPAMRSLLAAVIDRATVQFAVAGSGVNAEVIGGGIFRDVDVKRPNVLRPTVRYTCPTTAVGAVGDARLTVTSRGTTLEQSTAAISCVAAAAPVLEPPPAPAQEPRTATGVAPPPPPPVPAPVNPPQPNANPNPNPNPNPNTAVSAERQRQVQLQLATEDVRTNEQYAFSALPDQERETPWALALAAAAMAGTAASALRLRSAARPAFVRAGSFECRPRSRR